MHTRQVIHFSKLTQALLAGAVFVAVVIGVFFVSQNDAIVSAVELFGYWGLFGISFVSGFNFIIPIPVIALYPLLVEAGFHLWGSITVIALGMTIGDSVGYFIGSTGHKLIKPDGEQHTIVTWINKFRARHYLWPYIVLLLYASFAPAPNEIIVIPMAFMRYRFRYMLPIVFIGNFIFNTLAAFGITSIIGLL